MRSTNNYSRSSNRRKADDERPLIRGAAVEREHRDLYKLIKRYGLPSEEQFYRAIAAAHLDERPDYYEQLKKYVEG